MGGKTKTDAKSKQFAGQHWCTHTYSDGALGTSGRYPMETGDTESECAMFHTSIAEMAARVVASRLVVPFVVVILEPDSGHWR